MRNYKKYLAAVLAATMTVGAPAAVMAADVSGVTPTDITDVDEATGTIGGTGSLEGAISTDVFKITVTAPRDEEGFYNFILDPQKLIDATSGAAYTGKSFEAGKTLYFKNTVDGATYDYSATSDFVSITNKGTLDVDVSAKATVTGFGAEGGVALTSDSTFADSTDPSVYLAMKDQETTPNVQAISATDGATLSKTLAASTTANLWKVVHDGSDYVYQEDPSVAATATYNTYSFALTGACNPDGEWLDVTVGQPQVSVVWKVVPHESDRAPSIATTTYTMTAGRAVEVTVDLGAGTKIATGIDSITYAASSGNKTLATSNYSLADGKLTFTSSCIDSILNAGVTSRVMTVVFDDADATEIEITLRK